MQPTARTTRRLGLTLIGLLAIVMSIAVAIALLLPSLPTDPRGARRTVCASYLGSLGRAVATYAAMNRDNHPRAGADGDILWAPLNVRSENAAVQISIDMPASGSAYGNMRPNPLVETDTFLLP